MSQRRTIEVLFAPAEFAALPARDLSNAACIVFDVLRATSTIVTALANGASSIIPMSEIDECLELRQRRPEVLLAGERQGFRIGAEQADGIEFDLGNSPREFTREKVDQKAIALTTTNGSRALRACVKAPFVLAASFLNLRATAEYVSVQPVENVLVVCAGTFDQAALEDSLGAGAMLELLSASWPDAQISDSARMAGDLYQAHKPDLPSAIASSRNGRRLISIPELRDDVAWCLQRDIHPLVARLSGEKIRKL